MKWSELSTFTSKSEIDTYISKELPKFDNEYSAPMYSNSEIAKYKAGRRTEKSVRIAELRELGTLEVERQIAERVEYLRTKINVVETHLVSGAGSAVGKRTQATPRADEFDILSLDLYLRTGRHDFVFVDPGDLAPSAQDPSHLQQNYIVDVLVAGRKPDPDPLSPWTTDLEEVLAGMGRGVNKADMQVDERSLEEIAEEVDREEGV
jgi:hypothetical protein